MPSKTLILFVSCCVEQSRFDVMKQVIASIKEEELAKDIDLEGDMIVFDNGSTIEGTRELLSDNFGRVYATAVNEGYWSAIDWVLRNYHAVIPYPNKYEYIYIIESDHMHYAIERLCACESALDLHSDLGSVRTSEYTVAERHLYDKTAQRNDGRKYAWVSHINAITGKPVELEVLEPDLGIYVTNFLTCLHSVNRLGAMKQVFEQLRNGEGFSEQDFQRQYHELYPQVGLVDGGVFHAKLGFTPGGGSLSGSWSHDVSRLGYKTTRRDKIRPYSRIVERL